MHGYLASVDWYAAFIHGASDATQGCRYTRQRWLNRADILMPDGPQTLTVPLVSSTTHGAVEDILISDHGRWRNHHWNALQTAYGKSPFFEYYADDFRPFYTERWERLADYNAAIHATVMRLIDPGPALSIPTSYSSHEGGEPEAYSYYQVFAHTIGFHPHLSIVDLLFNMGPEAILVLMRA